MAKTKIRKSRGRQIELSVLNVKMPVPHSPERYVALFKDAYKLKNTASLQGDWVALLGSLRVSEEDHLVLQGDFYKYIDLDATRDWFNVQAGKPAEADDLKKISIPDHLKPHFQILSFVFFAKEHRLVLISREAKDSLSSQQAMKVLTGIFSAAELVAKYGLIEVVVEPSREALESIFNMKRLRSLYIEVTPPNPDDLEELEGQVFEAMRAQRAGVYKYELVEADNRGLAPTDEVKNLAKVAQSNGVVVGYGGDRGATKTLSTKNHPFVSKEHYDPETETRSAALMKRAKAILSTLIQKKLGA